MDLSKRISKTRLSRFSSITAFFISLGLVVGWSQPNDENAEILSTLGLKSGELITIAQDQAGKSELAFKMNGQDYVLDYTLQSNRSKRFRLLVQQDNGDLVERTAPSANTICGTLRGIEGSQVVGCITEDGCCAKIMLPSGEACYLEPVNRVVNKPAFARVHVVYSKDQVIATEKQCGAVTNLAQAAQNVAQPSTSATSVLQECELAVDADFEYFSAFGSVEAALARIELIINLVNNQYESEVGIRHTVSTAVIRATANDPYTTRDAEDLLDQLRDEYRFIGFDGDLCHLFTGKNLIGTTIGIAFTGVVCSRNFGYGLSQDVSPLTNMTDLVAHELGHNWNQAHCNCPNHTMNASLNGANDFNDTLTVPNLISYRDRLNCLDSITSPANDDLAGAVTIANPIFSVTGSNINSTTEPAEQNLVEVGSSLWWHINAEQNGRLSIDTFGSDFDTQLHVYESITNGGFAALDLVDNNDDAEDPTSGSSLQSQVTFDMRTGTRYVIRVGGFRNSASISDGSEGNIVLNGTLVSGFLLGDFDADGDVDCDDLDGYVGNIGATADPTIAPLDLDNDGTLTTSDANTLINDLIQTSNGIMGTFPGDLNCDGEVNVLGDGFVLIRNLQTPVVSYSQGDINFDGIVNVLGDGFILIANLGRTNNP